MINTWKEESKKNRRVIAALVRQIESMGGTAKVSFLAMEADPPPIFTYRDEVHHVIVVRMKEE